MGDPDERPWEIERVPIQLPRQHPAPIVEDIRYEALNIFQFFGIRFPFDEQTIIRFATLEENFPPEFKPNNVMERGGILLFIWADRLPTPATHLQQSIIRLPLLGQIADLPRFVFLYARAQNEPREGDRTNRCPLCGSHLLGLPLADHRLENCPFGILEGEQRLEFLAINHVSYCHMCNSRSATHSQCARPPCRQCNIVGHTVASGLCESPMGTTNLGQQHLLQQRVTTFRRNHLLRIRALTNRQDRPLQYRSYTDQAFIYLERRVQNRRNEMIGWSFYHDDAGEFPQHHPGRYSNYLEERPVHYLSLAPPEYHSQAVNRIPTFAPR